jgi:hypothetical protein
MAWGVWWGHETPDGNTHIVPCRDDGGEPAPPHSISMECPCLPTPRDNGYGGVMMVHNEIQ